MDGYRRPAREQQPVVNSQHRVQKVDDLESATELGISVQVIVERDLADIRYQEKQTDFSCRSKVNPALRSGSIDEVVIEPHADWDVEVNFSAQGVS